MPTFVFVPSFLANIRSESQDSLYIRQFAWFLFASYSSACIFMRSAAAIPWQLSSPPFSLRTSSWIRGFFVMVCTWSSILLHSCYAFLFSNKRLIMSFSPLIYWSPTHLPSIHSLIPMCNHIQAGSIGSLLSIWAGPSQSFSPSFWLLLESTTLRTSFSLGCWHGCSTKLMDQPVFICFLKMTSKVIVKYGVWRILWLLANRKQIN